MKLYVYKMVVPAYGNYEYSEEVLDSPDFVNVEEGWKLGDRIYTEDVDITLGCEDDEPDVLVMADVSPIQFAEDALMKIWEDNCEGHTRGDSYINE